MIALGTHTLVDGDRSMEIVLVTIHIGEQTIAHAQPSGRPIAELAGKRVLISGTPAIVTRSTEEVDLIDVTTEHYWAEHQRRQYVPGRRTVALELLLLEG